MKTKDISIIASKLAGKVDFNCIKFSQILPTEHGKSINHLVFVKEAFGVYFYTDSADLERALFLKGCKLPTYVCYKESNNLFELS